MSSRLSDPLDLLRRIPTPEPDAERMQATIAAARARFADPAPARRRLGWRLWLAPAAAALATVATVAVLLPQPDAPQLAESAPAQAQRSLAREPAAAPLVPDSTPNAAASAGRVLGIRPPQSLSEPAAAWPADVQRHDFDGFQIVTRKTAGGLALSFLREGGEQEFDRRSLDPGVGLKLLDGFLLLPPDGPELLALQSRIGTAVNWDVFTVEPDGLRLSGGLSRRVHDAPDRAAVAARLGASE